MLNVATGYSNTTLSCSELNGEHDGEHDERGTRPDITRSNRVRTKNNMCNREISSRRFDCFFFREALRPSGADRLGVVPPPPPPLAKVAKHGKRARVNMGRHTCVRRGGNKACKQIKCVVISCVCMCRIYITFRVVA